MILKFLINSNKKINAIILYQLTIEGRWGSIFSDVQKPDFCAYDSSVAWSLTKKAEYFLFSPNNKVF